LKAKEEIPAAIQEFQKVVKLKPDYADAFVNLGVLYSTQKKFDQAEQAYEEAIRLKPTMAEAYYNLGVFYEFHLKDTTRALAIYKKYLEVGGKDDRIQRIVRDMRK
jgi:tetratricopeptide (TPR) repeat protein